MKMGFLSAVSFATLLATAGCAPTLQWREPVSLADYPTDGYVASNMMTVAQRRMALPDGWSFKRKKQTDAKQIMFWIRDTGGDNVTGAYSFERLAFSVDGTRATERLAPLTMKGFDDLEGHRTEIDSTESYIIDGVKEDRRWRKVSGVLYGHFDQGTALSDITFLGDKAYVDQNMRVLYTIMNTFKLVPRNLSERKLKGSFSFKCDDGTVQWLDDEAGKWQEKGFTVAGAVDNGVLFAGVRRVSTTRFADFLKMSMFDPHEFDTTLHLAGASYPARAVHRYDTDKNFASTVLFFKHEGRDYLLEVSRAFKSPPGTVDPAMQDLPEARRVLDSMFYFYN
jgi:hypothetical protein